MVLWVSGTRRWSKSPIFIAVGLAVVSGLAMGATQTTPRDDAAAEPLPPPKSQPPAPDLTAVPTQEDPPVPDEAVNAREDEPDVAPATPQPQPRARWIRHRVVPRESLTQIATRYGVSVASVRKWNSLAEDAVIKPRDKLKIYARRFPAARELVEHVATVGDTWGSVSRAYGVSPSDLRAYNVRRTGRRLDEGERLYIWIDPTIYEWIQGYAAAPGPAADVYPGGHSVGSPNDGRLVNAARIPESDDYVLRFPNSSWGTSHAVSNVVTAMADFRERSGFTGRITLGTMSRERGGEVGGHKSHQSGRDIDIRLPVREGVPIGLRPKARTIDWEATWHLINAFIDTGEVAVIFFDYGRQRHLHRAATQMGVSDDELDRVIQYPIGKLASRGVVRHAHGHDAHIHVRFRCGAFETECTD